MDRRLSVPMRILFYAYLMTMPILLIFGFTYLLRSKFMPYHAVATGLAWEQVPSGIQFVFIAMMRVIGGSFIALVIVVTTILVIPFKQGYRWAHYCVPITGIACAGSSLYATAQLKLQTGANAPWIAALIPVVVYVIGLIITATLPRESNQAL